MKLHRVLKRIFCVHLNFGHKRNSVKEVLHVRKHFLFLLGFMQLFKNEENIFRRFVVRFFFISILRRYQITILFRVGPNFMNFHKLIYVLDMKLYIVYANELIDNVSTINETDFIFNSKRRNS